MVVVYNRRRKYHSGAVTLLRRRLKTVRFQEVDAMIWRKKILAWRKLKSDWAKIHMASVLISIALKMLFLWARTRHSGTQGEWNIRVHTVYLPQVAPGSLLSGIPNVRRWNTKRLGRGANSGPAFTYLGMWTPTPWRLKKRKKEKINKKNVGTETMF